MSEPRLRTGIWVQALIWRCGQQGVAATVARRGDPDAGAVLLKINRRGASFAVLTQARARDGALGWTACITGGTDEASADAYLARQVQRDPDLWIIEIEDAEAERFLDSPVLGS
ncbi:MAG: DUF1491 family protein [Alphaproteobacteria bacterium]|nr:DUF1491 family protein [Alphaproteobacteria bacterium]